jgi:DNA mismatch endonuclease, patch repair protein
VKTRRIGRGMQALTPAQLSAHMRRIRSVDTRPEVVVRKTAFSLGYRFRLYGKGLPGRPDLVFASRRKVIFVNGCFWHQHARCRLRSTPHSNSAYWLAKFARTKVRDRQTKIALGKLGWKSLVVWECETADSVLLSERITAFLSS